MSLTTYNQASLTLARGIVSVVLKDDDPDAVKPIENDQKAGNNLSHDSLSDKLSKLREKKVSVSGPKEQIENKLSQLEQKKSNLFNKDVNADNVNDDQEIENCKVKKAQADENIKQINAKMDINMKRQMSEETSKEFQELKNQLSAALEESRDAFAQIERLQKEAKEKQDEGFKELAKDIDEVQNEIKDFEEKWQNLRKEERTIDEEISKLEAKINPKPARKNEVNLQRPNNNGLGGGNKNIANQNNPQGNNVNKNNNGFAQDVVVGNQAHLNKNEDGIGAGGGNVPHDHGGNSGVGNNSHGGFGSAYIESAKALLRAVLALMIQGAGNNNPFCNIAKMLAGKSMVEVAKTLTEAGMTDEVVNKSPMLRHEALLVDTQAAGLRGIFETAIQYWNQTAQANKQIEKDTFQLAQRA